MFLKPSFIVFIMYRGRLTLLSLSDRQEDRGRKWVIVKSALTFPETDCRTHKLFIYSFINSYVLFVCLIGPELWTALVVLPRNLILVET
jgi:hypothetical protein